MANIVFKTDVPPLADDNGDSSREENNDSDDEEYNDSDDEEYNDSDDYNSDESDESDENNNNEQVTKEMRIPENLFPKPLFKKISDIHEIMVSLNTFNNLNIFTSEPFNLCGYSWKIMIYPPNIISSNHISIYLISIDLNNPKNKNQIIIQSDFKFEVFISNTLVISKGQSFEFTNGRVISGFNEFIDSRKITIPSNLKQEVKLRITLTAAEDISSYIPKNLNSELQKLNIKSMYNPILFSLFFNPTVRYEVSESDIPNQNTIKSLFQRFLNKFPSLSPTESSAFQQLLDKSSNSNQTPQECQRFYQELIISLGKHSPKINQLFNIENDKFLGMVNLPKTNGSFDNLLKKANLSSTKYPPILSIFNGTQISLKSNDTNIFPNDFYLNDIYPFDKFGPKNPKQHYILWNVWVYETVTSGDSVNNTNFYSYINIDCEYPINEWIKISKNYAQAVSFEYVLNDSNNVVNGTFHTSQLSKYPRSLSSANMLIYILESEIKNIFNPIHTHIKKKLPTESTDSNKPKPNSNSNPPPLPQQPYIDNDLYSKNEELTKRIRELENTVEKISNNLSEFEKKKDISDSLLANANKNVEKYKQASMESEQKMVKLNEQNTQFKSQNENYKKEFENLKKKSTQSEHDVNTAKKETEKIRKEKEAVEKQLYQAQIDKDNAIRLKDFAIKEKDLNSKERDFLQREKNLAVQEREEVTKSKIFLTKEIEILKTQLESKKKSKTVSFESEIDKDEDHDRIETMEPNELISLQQKFSRLMVTISKKIDENHCCSVCMSNSRVVVFYPCMHCVICQDCIPVVNGTCPVCRKKIQSTNKIFF